MSKLSLKLGAIFFLLLFGIETFMMFFLHTSLVNSRVEEELIALQARGNSHRAILEGNFNEETLSHVALMESEASTDVVIIDSTGKLLASSQQKAVIDKYLMDLNAPIAYEGQVIEDDWKKEEFIATVSPIKQKEQVTGYVLMIQNTDSVQSLIERLNKHFFIVGIISGVVTIIIIILLSKRLAKPLILMKDATMKMSKGDFSVALSASGKDELSDLSSSIQLLANDLQYIKQERNEFLSSIAHELRTPITFIKGYTDIVYKREMSEVDQKKYLAIILEETNRLSSLVTDLFDLAKMDENSFAIHNESIDMSAFLKQIKMKLAPAFEEREIQFDVYCKGGIMVMADPLRLEQVLINLLDNALKHCVAGDTTTLSIQSMKQSVKIFIEDSGKGIPAKDLPHIFERFYRVEKSRSRALGGTGLGLAIVKELVYAQGGELKVRSEEGKGTKFELIFRGVGNDEKTIINR
ncbi:MAG: ATP-binding protein [Lysinibacillus sp.]